MPGPARRWRQPTVLAAVVGLLVLPVVLDADDLPLSTYPMYSRARQAEVDFVTALGVDADHIAGRADERCEEIRQRVLDRRPDGATLTIRVVSERHDVIEHTADRPSLRGRTVYAECGGAT
jgi:hypothetical protein